MMMRTHITAVRHGQTIWNEEGRLQGHGNSSLTIRGRLQAERLGKRLAMLSHQVIYSSTLERAVETAEIISKRTGCNVAVDVRLNERDYGIFEGLTRQEIKKKYPTDFMRFRSHDPDYTIPQGESTRTLFERCIQAFEELARHHEGQSIIIVTHRGVLDCLFRHIFGIPLNRPRRFKVLEASFNLLQFLDGEWMLETWGDVSHYTDANDLKG